MSPSTEMGEVCVGDVYFNVIKFVENVFKGRLTYISASGDHYETCHQCHNCDGRSALCMTFEFVKLPTDTERRVGIDVLRQNGWKMRWSHLPNGDFNSEEYEGNRERMCLELYYWGVDLLLDVEERVRLRTPTSDGVLGPELVACMSLNQYEHESVIESAQKDEWKYTKEFLKEQKVEGYENLDCKMPPMNTPDEMPHYEGMRMKYEKGLMSVGDVYFNIIKYVENVIVGARATCLKANTRCGVENSTEFIAGEPVARQMGAAGRWEPVARQMGAGRSADGRSALCMTFECPSNSGTDLSVLEQNGWQTLWEGKMLKVWHWDDELMRDVEGRMRKAGRGGSVAIRDMHCSNRIWPDFAFFHEIVLDYYIVLDNYLHEILASGRTRRKGRLSHGGELPHKDLNVSCSVKETQQ